MPAKNDPKRSKADALAAEGTLNPAPEKVRDPKFREGEFLRSARSRAGQVRDAAPCLRRERIDDGRVRRVRGLSADLLPGQGELRRGRHSGIGAQEARPARTAQAPGRGPGVSQGAAYSRRADPGTRALEVDPAESSISMCIPRTIERALRGKKNAAMTVGRAADPARHRPPLITSQYETAAPSRPR